MSEMNDKIEPKSEGTADFYENLAAEYGWKPEGKKTAEEYIKYALDELPKRGEALSLKNKKIEAKDTELEKMRIIVDQLALDMKKQKEITYSQALEKIKAQKHHAIEAGNVEQVEKLEEQEKKLQLPEKVSEFPAVEAFKQKHASWINGVSVEELEMQAYASQMDKILANKNLGPDKHMQALEEAIQKKFSSYFSEDNGEVSHVEPVQHENNVISRKRLKNFTFDDLTDAQKMAAQYLADRKQMTISEYIKKLVELGELK